MENAWNSLSESEKEIVKGVLIKDARLQEPGIHIGSSSKRKMGKKNIN